MNLGQTVFSQLIEHLPHKEFQKCVARYRGDHYLKSFSCWDQFLAMGFAQLTYRESLRDIEACLRSMQSKLYHIDRKSTRLNSSHSSISYAVFCLKKKKKNIIKI